MSRIRGPYVRFCERDEAGLITRSHPTRFMSGLYGSALWIPGGIIGYNCPRHKPNFGIDFPAPSLLLSLLISMY